jgi:hypothetical protein
MNEKNNARVFVIRDTTGKRHESYKVARLPYHPSIAQKSDDMALRKHEQGLKVGSMGDKVIVGTSDIAVEDPDAVRCTPEEEDYFLEMIARVFPAIRVGREHIIFRFSGVRPLLHQGEECRTDHSRSPHPGGQAG